MRERVRVGIADAEAMRVVLDGAAEVLVVQRGEEGGRVALLIAVIAVADDQQRIDDVDHAGEAHDAPQIARAACVVLQPLVDAVADEQRAHGHGAELYAVALGLSDAVHHAHGCLVNGVKIPLVERAERIGVFEQRGHGLVEYER